MNVVAAPAATNSGAEGHLAHTRRRAARGILAGLTAVAVTVGLAGCDSGAGGAGSHAESTSAGPPPSTDYFGYQANSGLSTTNAGSALGTANNAQVLSGRLYPSAYVSGPNGQMIPNTDLVKTEEFPGEQRSVLYTLSDKATYNDGAPVTCDDYLLAYKAGTMSELFDSHMPLMDQIDTLQCGPGKKTFLVTFKPGQGDRWRYMFGPGTVVPSHAIAKKAGMSQEDLLGALYAEDADQLAEVARLWRDGFDTDNFDPDLQVSFGPFVIDRVGRQGEVVLKRNDHYYGNPATLEHITVWPKDANTAGLLQSGNLKVIDAPEANPGWLDRNAPDNPFEIESMVGDLTDSLVLSHSGLFADQGARQAFAECVDQGEIAKVSSEAFGVDVPPVYTHSVRHTDPMVQHLKNVVEEHAHTDIDKASALSGETIRVGYLGPDERLSKMVDSLKKSCEPAGITIEDVSDADSSPARLEPDSGEEAPQADAFLTAVDPLREQGGVSANMKDYEDLRKMEQQLWDEVNVIPLAGQPRTFVIDRAVRNVVPYTGLSGIGWNMDRWIDTAAPEPEEQSEEPSER